MQVHTLGSVEVQGLREAAERRVGDSATLGLDLELVAYLDRYLPHPDLDYDQTAALGSLLLLDAKAGTDHAARFLAPDGLWQQWVEGPLAKDRDDSDTCREFIGLLCAFADESAKHCPTRAGPV